MQNTRARARKRFDPLPYDRERLTKLLLDGACFQGGTEDCTVRILYVVDPVAACEVWVGAIATDHATTAVCSSTCRSHRSRRA